MAKITRYQGDLEGFSSSALGQERIVFGDTGTTQSDDLTDNINSDFLRGWGALALGNKPPREWFNSVHFVSTQLSAYLHQMGVAEWHTDQEYFLGSMVVHNGVTWQLKVASDTGTTPAVGDTWTQASSIVADNLKDMADLPLIDRAVYSCSSFYAGKSSGGGLFIYDSSKSKTEHDGVSVIDPDRVTAWNGTHADLSTLYTAAGSGSGVYVRLDTKLHMECAGTESDGVTDDTLPISQAVLSAKARYRGKLYGFQKYKVEGLELSDVSIEGVGVGENDIPYDDNGSLFIVTGTSTSAFILERGVKIDGFSFFYPDQDGVAVSPIVYPSLFKFKDTTTSTNITITNCVLINPYIAFEITAASPNAHGRISVSNVQCYAVDTFIQGNNILDDVHFNDFILSPGVYQDVTQTGAKNLYNYTSQNGTFMVLTGDIDGLSFDQGLVFGYRYGIQANGDVDLMAFTGVSFDRVITVIQKTGGEIRNTSFSGCDFFCFNPDFDAIVDDAFKLSGATSKAELSFDAACTFIKASNRYFVIDDDLATTITIKSNRLSGFAGATGLSGAVYAIDCANANAKVYLNGFESDSGYVNSGVFNGISFDVFSARGTDAFNMDTAFKLTSGNIATLVGNMTEGTVTASVDVGTVGRIVNTANNFDLP